MTATAHPKDFKDVNPATVYSVADVAALIGKSIDTVREWVKGGRLPCLPRVGSREQIRVLGSDVLALLGERARSLPGPTETRAERAKRGKADLDAIRAMKGKPAGRK